MKALRASLALLQVAGFLVITSLSRLAHSAQSAAGAQAAVSLMPARFGMIVILAFIIASAILSGFLSHRLGRAVPLWVIGALFVPIFCPLILAFLNKVPNTSYTPPARTSVEAGPVQAADAPDGTVPAFTVQGFCQRCVAETTDESPGSVSTINGIGTALQGTRWKSKGLDPCPYCGSVVQQKWRMFGFPVKPLGSYRILYVKQGLLGSRYYGRRLKNDPVLMKPS